MTPKVPFGRSPIHPVIRQWLLALAPIRYRVPLRYYYRRWARTLDPEFALLPTLVGRGQRAVDVGANLGVYTYALSRLCRKVEAFEPVPFHMAALRAFRQNRVTVHQVALSSRNGSRNLYFPRDGGEVDLGRGTLTPIERGSDVVEVPVKTLDEYGFTDVSFIKVDVEGHELDVLKGARQTILASHPSLLVEIEQRHISFPMSDVFNYLAELGYRGSFLEKGKLRPLAEFSYERHQAALLRDVFARGYVNNFIFQP